VDEDGGDDDGGDGDHGDQMSYLSYTGIKISFQNWYVTIIFVLFSFTCWVIDFFDIFIPCAFFEKKTISDSIVRKEWVKINNDD
jgi:hypothetical protein